MRFHALAAAAALALAGCAQVPTSGTNQGLSNSPAGSRTATITRTANGVPHITAPDMETLAYGVAYAHAQDNVCQTAQQLVTARGERSRWFGPTATALLGRSVLANEIIDTFVAAHMNDAALEKGTAAHEESLQMARGYVAGYNRFLTDRAGNLPAACKGQPWVRAMTLADFLRANELAMVQASSGALGDAIVGARPPQPAAAKTSAAPASAVDLADAAGAMRDAGLLDSPLGSNAWAFGRDATADGRGLLLGNPHFPWAGVNRFYLMHLTIPGSLDAMGGTTGLAALVNIGFNQDVAWSHTVSTGKRFTLHELALVPGDPTSYIVDGKPEKMTTREVAIDVLNGDHTVSARKRTLYVTRWGPVLVIPRAGLNWTDKVAYAIQDANAGNTRGAAAWLALNRARNVAEVRGAMAQLGMPWVNTLAADRHGDALYADHSVVPDVDAAQLQRCAPSAPAAALRNAAGLIVLDGSRSDCDWRRDPASPVPGLTPIARMPAAVRSDWVHNSNDSFFYTHPGQTFGSISPLVGDARLERPRTRAGLTEIPDLLARGKVTAQALQQQLFENRNFIGGVVMPDLLAACKTAPEANQAARDGCAALAGWDRKSDVESRGAHLFREFWRTARSIPNVWRVPFDANQPAATPAGLKMDDAAVAGKIWEALAGAVNKVRAAGFALDAPLKAVQRPLITDEAIAVHGGEDFEGVLNNVGNQFAPGITAKGLRIDYGTSYVQTVGFDARGPVAQAILTYGESTDPASPLATDQLKLFSRKEWPTLPFHAEDVEKARVGAVLKLTR